MPPWRPGGLRATNKTGVAGVTLCVQCGRDSYCRQSELPPWVAGKAGQQRGGRIYTFLQNQRHVSTQEHTRGHINPRRHALATSCEPINTNCKYTYPQMWTHTHRGRLVQTLEWICASTHRCTNRKNWTPACSQAHTQVSQEMEEESPSFTSHLTHRCTNQHAHKRAPHRCLCRCTANSPLPSSSPRSCYVGAYLQCIGAARGQSGETHPGTPTETAPDHGSSITPLMLRGRHLKMMTAGIPAHFLCLYWRSSIETIPPVWEVWMQGIPLPTSPSLYTRPSPGFHGARVRGREALH